MSAENEHPTSAPRHVFISYSRKDKPIVDTLVADLRAAEIPVWFDEDLKPDTPNWDAAIRQAIASSYAVIYVASPAAGNSKHAFGELEIANAASRRIVPVWVAGDVWSACVPLSLVSAQRTDLRPSSYQSKLPDLIGWLRGIMNEFPGIIAVDAHEQIPPGHFMIEFDGIQAFDPHRPEPGSPPIGGLAVRPSGFASFEALTTRLYLDYLQGIVPPYTYGREWILISAYYREVRAIVAPLDWLRYRFERDWIPVSVRSREWVSSSLATLGLVPGTRWTIVSANQQEFKDAVGVVTNDPDFSSVASQLSVNDQEKSGLVYKAIAQLLYAGVSYEKTFTHLPWDALSSELEKRGQTPDQTSSYRYRYIFTVPFQVVDDRPAVVDDLPGWFHLLA